MDDSATRPALEAPVYGARNRHAVYVAAGLRALANGLLGVTLGVYLAHKGLSTTSIGAVVSAGLWGCAAGALVATLLADRLGRRLFLVGLGLLGAAGAASTLALNPASPADAFFMAAAAFAGMLNGMGRDRGAGSVIEQSILPGTVGDAGRTKAFAWYNVVQDAGQATGSLIPGLIALAFGGQLLGMSGGKDFLGDISGQPLGGQHLSIAVALYAALMLATAIPAMLMTSGAEARRTRNPLRLTPQTRKVLFKLCALFSIDSIAGGFLVRTLLPVFFITQFGASVVEVSALFFLAGVANALSHLGAAWLARRIGLVNTMVFTHIPSSVLLMTVTIAPNFWVAAVLFLVRESMVEMDVPARQSYVMAMVAPEERTAAAGITSLVRMAGWAVAPAFAGAMMAGIDIATPLVIGASMKIAYDILLWISFRRLKPPEERTAPR